MSEEKRPIKEGERAYVLYIGLREYNGDFKEEIHFRNVWTSHEEARKWMNVVVDAIRTVFKKSGIEPMTEETLKLSGESSAPADDAE